MGWGRLYEVQSSAKTPLSTCHTKAEWYEALNRLDIENAPQLNAEESIRSWASKFDGLGHPIARFFEGDLHAPYDEADDPNVCFVGPELARSSFGQLDQLGKQFFVELFPHNAPFGVGESWLYEPLLAFLKPLCERGNAVVILWEN